MWWLRKRLRSWRGPEGLALTAASWEAVVAVMAEDRAAAAGRGRAPLPGSGGVVGALLGAVEVAVYAYLDAYRECLVTDARFRGAHEVVHAFGLA